MQQHFSVRKIRPRWALFLCLFGGLFGTAQTTMAAQACGTLQIEHAWVRVVPGAPVSAGYFDLMNPGNAAITVSAISSPQFARVHMHESIVQANGMATMKPVDAVIVAPGQTVSFAPGGYHLMMFDAVEQLAPGDSVTLNVTCDGSDNTRAITAEARSMTSTDDDNVKMDHGHMDMDMSVHHGS